MNRSPQLTRYMRGGCYALALWLHRRTGLPIYALADETGTPHHVFVLDEAEQLAYDARDRLTMEQVPTWRGRRSAGTIVRPCTVEEIARLASITDAVPSRTLAAFARKQPDLASLIRRTGSPPESAP